MDDLSSIYLGGGGGGGGGGTQFALLCKKTVVKILHVSIYISYSNALFVCLYVRMDSISFQTAGVSSQNFQGLLRTPHCTSS